MSRVHLVPLLLVVLLACGGPGSGTTNQGGPSTQQVSSAATSDPGSSSGAATSTSSGATPPTATPVPVPADPGTTAPAPTPSPTPSSGFVPITAIAGAPGTPAAVAPDPNAPTAGASGTNRFQIGAAQGLYVVDPTAGEPAVQGLVVVTSGSISSGNFIPPADTVVTLNGVPLLRDPNLNGAYWRVDPAAPAPLVGSGGELVLTATATVSGSVVERTLVLPCPADVAVDVTRSATTVHLSSPVNLTVNTGIAILGSITPAATLFGYDPAARTLSPSGAPSAIAPGALALDVSLTATNEAAYLLDLRWPGPWVPDGESGAFCGLVKRWAFLK